MRLGSKQDVGSNVAIGTAAFAIVVALLFILLVPQPTIQQASAAQKVAEEKVLADAEANKKDLDEINAKLASWTWKGGQQQIGPSALNSMSGLAKQNQVKLSGFRPQRPNSASGLELLPFAVTAEGAYPDVLRFVKAIETSGGRLVVDRVQVASAEANSNQVTAVVGITAFRVAEVSQ